MVFIGNSRVLVGWSPDVPNRPNEKVYNLACPAMTLSEIREYLHFACLVHTPKKVFIGLDITHFGKYIECASEEKEKLHILAQVADSPILQVYAFKDDFQLNRSIFALLRKKMKEKSSGDVCYKGWDKYRGMRKIPINKIKMDLINEKKKQNVQHLDLKSWECLCDIHDMLRSKEIDVTVFFNPLMKEYNDIVMSSWGREEVMCIKQKVANLFGKVYDFNIENKFTKNYGLYSDISHYNVEMGKLMKAAIFGECADKTIVNILYSNDKNGISQ